jgi:hypothetical protein
MAGRSAIDGGAVTGGVLCIIKRCVQFAHIHYKVGGVVGAVDGENDAPFLLARDALVHRQRGEALGRADGSGQLCVYERSVATLRALQTFLQAQATAANPPDWS